MFDKIKKQQMKKNKKTKQNKNKHCCDKKSYLIVWWMNHSNQHMINRRLLCIILSHSSKSGTIGFLTSFWKIAISPDCNVQISCNKRQSKAKTSLVTLIYVLFAIIFNFDQTRALFRCTIFSTPCIFWLLSFFPLHGCHVFIFPCFQCRFHHYDTNYLCFMWK